MEHNSNYLFTSESASEGHPDKLCDLISDNILDAHLADDSYSRVACEVATSTGFVVVFGEITSKARIDICDIISKTINQVGYDKPEYGYCANRVAKFVSLDEQDDSIRKAVDTANYFNSEKGKYELGAGDQGIMFGYAVRETPQLMPLPITLAHMLNMQLAKLRKEQTISYLRPDSKTQVSVEYTPEHKPASIKTVVVSTQHDPGISLNKICENVTEKVIKPVLGEFFHNGINIFVNPAGEFVTGGPVADAGLTGRKIIVDTYGGAARHGGGAFSGKDATKVDRSGSYMARYIAKNVVAAELADRFEIQLSYAIGVANPTSISVNSYGTNKIAESRIVELIKSNFDLRPEGIIETLQLRRPIFAKTTNYGHFGREDEDFTWEKKDKIQDLLKSA